jgi:hypothetical protein
MVASLPRRPARFSSAAPLSGQALNDASNITVSQEEPAGEPSGLQVVVLNLPWTATTEALQVSDAGLCSQAQHVSTALLSVARRC